jgi:hypothetical protein
MIDTVSFELLVFEGRFHLLKVNKNDRRKYFSLDLDGRLQSYGQGIKVIDAFHIKIKLTKKGSYMLPSFYSLTIFEFDVTIILFLFLVEEHKLIIKHIKHNLIVFAHFSGEQLFR